MRGFVLVNGCCICFLVLAGSKNSLSIKRRRRHQLLRQSGIIVLPRRQYTDKAADALLRPHIVYYNPRIHRCAPVGDDIGPIIARLSSVQEVHLIDSNVSDRILLDLSRLPTLRMLDLRGTSVTARAVSKFTATNPECKVVLTE
jgi:hypothetical protein